MAKFTGRTKGLDPKKLAALEKVLREAGIKGNIGINSGLRNVDKAYELYQLDLKKRFPKLKLSMEKLPESSRKAIRERMLRGEYKGKGKPVKNLYPRNAWNRKGLVKQLIKDGISAVESQKIADQVALQPCEERWDTYSNELRPDINSPCMYLWERMYIWFDGICNPCDVDYKSYLETGNINKKSIRDVWHGEMYTKLREDHLSDKRKKWNPCDRCGLC